MTYTVFSYNTATAELELSPTHAGVFLTAEAAAVELAKQEQRFAQLAGSMAGDYRQFFLVLDAATENTWAALGARFRSRY